MKFDLLYLKNLNKIYKESLFDETDEEDEDFETISIDGEYWITDDGDPIYADGDIGDKNHEVIVIEQCAGTLAAEFGLGCPDWECWETESNLEKGAIRRILEDEDFLKELYNLTDEEFEETDVEDLVKNDPANAIIEYLIYHDRYDKQAATDLVMVAYGSMRDAREYGVKTLKWHRVHGDSIETNKLTADNLKIIARGINEIIHQEGLGYSDEEDEEIREKRLAKHEYSISTYSGKLYTITLEDMEKGNVSGLELEVPPTNNAAKEQLDAADRAMMRDYYKDKPFGDSFENLFQSIIN